MDMETCEQCGKKFKSELSVKIHKGLAHGAKAKKGNGRKAAQAGATAPASKGGVVCDICGRSFTLPAHLGRHRSIAHKAASKPKAPRKTPLASRRRAVNTTAGADVADLSIDTLLALKSVVDARLAAIVEMMRKAKVNV